MSESEYREWRIWKQTRDHGEDRNVLIIGDPHEPFCLEGYPEFCKEQAVKYGCNIIVHIGDHVDNHKNASLLHGIPAVSLISNYL
ncbi:MAG: metallophosphoesterase [bacterium]|nr:metallophosphoesterase [bacterium]